MKTLALATLMFLPFVLFAQQDSSAAGTGHVETDTLTINAENKQVQIIATTRAGIDTAESVTINVVSTGQQDSLPKDTAARQAQKHAVVLSAGPGGMHAGIDRTDTLKEKNDTIRLTTKRKLIRIITTPRTDIDTTESFADKLKDLRRYRRNLFTYWAGVELGINTFITSDGRVGDGPESGPLQLNNARSRFFAINFMEEKVEFGGQHAGLFTGLGLEFINYKLSENNTLTANGDSTWAVPMTDPDLRKNKLRQIGLRLPVMLEFNTARAKLPADEEALKAKPDWSFSRKHNFHLAAGVVGSWYFDTMYKQKYTEGGHTVKQRSKDDYNLLPYRLAARAQIGFGGLNLFAEYGLTPIFEDGTAPTLNALNIGITLVGFN